MNVNSFAMDGVVQRCGLNMAVLPSSSGRAAWMNRPCNEMYPWRHISVKRPTCSLTVLLQAHKDTHLSPGGSCHFSQCPSSSKHLISQRRHVMYKHGSLEVVVLLHEDSLRKYLLSPIMWQPGAKVLFNISCCLTLKTIWELDCFPLFDQLGSWDSRKFHTLFKVIQIEEEDRSRTEEISRSGTR